MSQDTTLLDGLDPDLSSRLASRRDLFRKASVKLGAAATAPLILAAVSSEAVGQGLPAQVVDILNFALTLEYLESDFYRAAAATPGLIPPQFAQVLTAISRDEDAHVNLLLMTLGSAAIPKPQFDLTGRGRYPDILSNFNTTAKVAQTLEDTGVAAYKGQAPKLTGGGDLLTTALRIHSVEARHAAELRRLRGVRSWDGAFDRPLTKAQVLARARPFIVG